MRMMFSKLCLYTTEETWLIINIGEQVLVNWEVGGLFYSVLLFFCSHSPHFHFSFYYKLGISKIYISISKIYISRINQNSIHKFKKNYRCLEYRVFSFRNTAFLILKYIDLVHFSLCVELNMLSLIILWGQWLKL